MAWRFDVMTKTIANCVRHCKIWSEDIDVPESENGQLQEDIQGLTGVISNLRYRNVMDVEYLLNYPNENDAVVESPTNEEIIESVMNDENDLEPDDSSAIPNVSSKDSFQAMVTLKIYLLQHEQNIPELVQVLHKIKDAVHFCLGGRERQSTIDDFF
ncbi:uncharacterized protein LOC113312729 [Papaver somniferum]|uniref:uncharacterized protein LOC113312729 n=1 Tax=Papaver somniferum TaxID=3469 RepID=UPI000E6F5845|nr:uncharacterized protein LOC113312729 [Papaver somniferum]